MYTPDSIPELAFVRRLSRLMDSQFAIGGFRFGLDALLGLFPVVGDVLGLGTSGILLVAAVRHGASGSVLMRMLLNILLDFTIGEIPLLGDLFDIVFRANERNYALLAEHYYEGKHNGRAWPYLVAISGVLIGLLGLAIALVWWALSWAWSLW